MQKNILLVEDSEVCKKIATEAIKTSGNVIIAGSCLEARQLLKNHSFDLMIIDLGLPDGNGMDLYQEVVTGHKKTNIPTIFVTGDTDVLKKVAAFSFGAADYITKPYSPIELKARVDRILKHSDELSHIDLQDIGLHIDLSQFRAYYEDPSGQKFELDLTPHEFKILVLFVKNQWRVFTRQQIIDQVWGYETFITPRTVDTHISGLRKKIKDVNFLITAVRGEGYKGKKAA